MNHSHPALSLLSELLAVASPPGYEWRLAKIVSDRLDALGLRHETDGAGNVLVRFAGINPDAPRVCIAAHMDEIGFVVTAIEPAAGVRVASTTHSGGPALTRCISTSTSASATRCASSTCSMTWPPPEAANSKRRKAPII